jgi:hypothetical protein
MKDLTRRIETVFFILILMVGVALRLAALPISLGDLRPGENDHLDAVRQIEQSGLTPTPELDNVLFEPLYPVLVAGMNLLIPDIEWAARLVSAILGILLLGLVYLWVRLATQNRWLALAVMAGLATSFWGLMLSQAIQRAVVLAVLYMAAASFMRQGFTVEEDIDDEDFLPFKYRPQAQIEGWLWFALAGIFLGLSLYTHPAARLMWLAFPAFFVIVALDQPGVIRRIWPGLGIMLIVAGLIAIPLISYLARHPDQLFIRQVAELAALAQRGDVEPLRRRLRIALGVMTVRGDTLPDFNLPGRPLLGPMMSLLFYIGVSIALTSLAYPYRPSRRGQRSFDDSFRVTSANVFMMLTLIFGLGQVFLDGLAGSTTSAVGLMPALYFFPALAIQWMADSARQYVGANGPKALWTAYGVGLIVITGMTIHTAFNLWPIIF